MSEEWMASQVVDNCSDAVEATDPQVVALGDVVGEHNLRVLTDSRECRQQDVAFEILRLIDDDECVGDRAAPDVGQGKDLEQFAVDDLVDHLRTGDGLECITDGRSPWRHLLGLRTRQIAEILTAHGVERSEDDHLRMGALFEYCFQRRSESQNAFPSSGPTAE